eukprot:NODE_16563_length_988_cov_2.192799.p1 GENE.NODE_16563_length_988_cov_2.192799~~NODE_16563_length_988_cov_2.192799.p1  ORF type:complete len:214 (-),score=50.28 NODE_16563_length_988_cov_2.192799:140-781(-)
MGVGSFFMIVFLLAGVGLAALSSAKSSNSGGEQEEVLLGAPAIGKVRGALIAASVGLLNGSLMMPMQCFSKGCHGIGVQAYPGGELASIAFLPSLSIGLICVQPALFLVYFLLYFRPNGSGAPWRYPNFNVKVVALPGLLTGMFWGMGNFAAMFATVYLGQTVGFPLTQCCLVINGLWGILYYKEITGNLAIGLFILAGLVIIAGAVLGGKYG